MNKSKSDGDPCGIVILRLRELRERTTLSYSYLYELIELGLFAPLLQLGGRSTGLPEHVLAAWLAQCMALRESMGTLRDAVELPQWRPAVEVIAPVRGIRMLRLREVESRVGFRRSQIYRNIEAGTFPRPVPLGARVRRWAAHEVEQWMRERAKMLTRLREADRDWYLRPPRRDDDDRPGSGSPP